LRNHYSISSENPPKASELLKLFNQTSWAKKRSIDGTRTLLENTQIFVTIRKDNILIGYGRAISDGIYRALVDDIVIDENYREKGLGKDILSVLLEKLQAVDEIFLNTGEHLEVFYEKFGFERAKCLTMKLKKDYLTVKK